MNTQHPLNGTGMVLVRTLSSIEAIGAYKIIQRVKTIPTQQPADRPAMSGAAMTQGNASGASFAA